MSETTAQVLARVKSRGPNARCEGGYSIGEPCYCPVCRDEEKLATAGVTSYILDGETLYRAARSATKTPMERALANPGSLRRAVDAHCYQCMGEGQDPGTWERVKTCHIESCALHHVRRKS